MLRSCSSRMEASHSLPSSYEQKDGADMEPSFCAKSAIARDSRRIVSRAPELVAEYGSVVPCGRRWRSKFF